MAELPEAELARSLLVGLRPQFAEREATARQLAELLLDAIAAALPLTRHEPSDRPLAQIESLAQQVDVYAWDGAPGWDVVLRDGIGPREPLEPGPSILDGLGAKPERTQQRGELKRRAHAEAERLVALGREAARFAAGGTGAGAQVLDQPPTLPASGVLVALHATLLRLIGLAAVAPLLTLNEDAAPLPPGGPLDREMDDRGEGFASAHEEWLARLLTDNPAAAEAPAFRTFFAGLAQSLRAAIGLRQFDAEAVLGAVASWQPARWGALRGGAPSTWMETFCPAAPANETAAERFDRERKAALDLMARLWFARNVSASGLTALAALFVARCASALAIWEEAR